MSYDIESIASAITEDPSVLVYHDSRNTMVEQDRAAARDITLFLTESVVGTDTLLEDMQAATYYLLEAGYSPEVINEGLWDWLKSIGSGALQTMKEKVAGWAMRLFGFDPKSSFGKFVAITFGNVDLMDIPKLFTDCNFAVNKLTDSLGEYFAREFASNIMGDGFVASTIGNVLSSAVNDEGFIETLQQQIVPKICNAIRGTGKKLLTKANGQQNQGQQGQDQQGQDQQGQQGEQQQGDAEA